MKKLRDYKDKYKNLSIKKNLKGKEAFEAVQRDGYTLRFVLEQTESICLAAVQYDAYALRYVRKQTEAICMAAVQEDGLALQYVQEQTPRICMAAVQNDGDALQYVQKQTEAICLAAIRQNILSLKYVKPHFFEDDSIIIDGKEFSKSTIKAAFKSLYQQLKGEEPNGKNTKRL